MHRHIIVSKSDSDAIGLLCAQVMAQVEGLKEKLQTAEVELKDIQTQVPYRTPCP